MKFAITISIGLICLLSSCRSTRNIQTAVAKKDSVNTTVNIPLNPAHEDSMLYIRETLNAIRANYLDFTTFSAKIDLDYEEADGKKYNVNAHVRMYKDSVIWISITAILGIEGLRVYITPDSVKLLDKQNKVYMPRSVAFLQEMTALPLDLPTLQDLFLGNPVFLDSAIISYSKGESTTTLQSNGLYFKNLFTVEDKNKWVQSSKLDDKDLQRNRTCYLTYGDYEDKKGPSGQKIYFATKRSIHVSEKKKLDIKMDFKQIEFNEKLSFPFSVPKNYQVN